MWYKVLFFLNLFSPNKSLPFMTKIKLIMCTWIFVPNEYKLWIHILTTVGPNDHTYSLSYFHIFWQADPQHGTQLTVKAQHNYFLRKPVISKPDNLFNKNNGMFVQHLVRVWTHSFLQMLSWCIFLTQRDDSSCLWTTFWLNKYDVVWVLQIVSEWSELKVVIKVTPMWRWHLSTRPKHLKYIWKCNWCSMPNLLLYKLCNQPHFKMINHSFTHLWILIAWVNE